MDYTYNYPRPAVTADCIVITKEVEPKVLLVQRGGEPFKGCWAFPGGFMDMDETTEQCAIRELEEETGLKVTEVHQIGAYSKVDRDPRGRTVSVSYLAIMDYPMPVKGQNFCGGVQVTVERTKFMQMMHVGKNVTDNVGDNVGDVSVMCR